MCVLYVSSASFTVTHHTHASPAATKSIIATTYKRALTILHERTNTCVGRELVLMEEGVRGGGGGGVRQEAASGRAHGSLHSKPGSTVRPS